MSRPTIAHPIVGGNGGDAWTDDVISNHVISVQKVVIRAGDLVDSVKFTYNCADGTTYYAPKYGGAGGSSDIINLRSDERLVRVEGKTDGQAVNQLTFMTRRKDGTDRTYGPFGSGGEQTFSFEGCILGFYGRSGQVLNAIGAFCLPPLVKSVSTAGSTDAGEEFDDNIDDLIPPVIGISKLVIGGSDSILSIQATYKQLGGFLYEGKQHGDPGRHITTVVAEKDECFYQLEGKSSSDFVGQLTMHSFVEGYSTTHGPYGKTGETSFEFNGKIIGFHGRVTKALTQLGVYYVSEL